MKTQQNTPGKLFQDLIEMLELAVHPEAKACRGNVFIPFALKSFEEKFAC